MPRWLRVALMAAGSLLWTAGHAQLPGDLVYRTEKAEQALPLLRDAVIVALRGLPGMEPGYPKAAMIHELPIPGRPGEKRLHFEPVDNPGADVRGILLDSRGSALQLQQSMMTARARMITVYLLRPDQPLASESDYFSLQQIEISFPYLAPGSTLDIMELVRVMTGGMKHVGAYVLSRPEGQPEVTP